MLSNTEIVRRGYEHFVTSGDLLTEFLRAWTDAWDDWQLEVDSLQEAGDNVLAIVHQSGRSKSTGLHVDMTFAQVWTFRDGLQARMTMFQDLSEATRYAGVAEETTAEG